MLQQASLLQVILLYRCGRAYCEARLNFVVMLRRTFLMRRKATAKALSTGPRATPHPTPSTAKVCFLGQTTKHADILPLC